jgi:hypothetical protein
VNFKKKKRKKKMSSPTNHHLHVTRVFPNESTWHDAFNAIAEAEQGVSPLEKLTCVTIALQAPSPGGACIVCTAALTNLRCSLTLVPCLCPGVNIGPQSLITLNQHTLVLF